MTAVPLIVLTGRAAEGAAAALVDDGWARVVHAGRGVEVGAALAGLDVVPGVVVTGDAPVAAAVRAVGGVLIRVTRPGDEPGTARADYDLVDDDSGPVLRNQMRVLGRTVIARARLRRTPRR